ncbi:MAG: hypothetical protein IT159_11210 [Bryobacterales bacterium]|nr:hypothetical protein [Bryobacterales bacterium]
MNKSLLIAILVTLVWAAVASVAQTPPGSGTAVMGRGRGGAPYAWNDKDKDGICDLTGRPVGQGRWAATAGAAAGRGRGGAPYAWGDKDKDGICDITGRPVGQGRGAGMGWGGGRGRGFGRWFAARQPQPTQPPQTQSQGTRPQPTQPQQ